MYRTNATERGRVVIVFADLAGFTAFADRHGDEAASECAARFALRVMQLGRRHSLRPVKTLGDGVLLVGRDPIAALTAARKITDHFDGTDGRPAAHVGVHCGDVIERDDDVYGRAVNLAAKLVAAAPPHDVVVTDALAEAASELENCRAVPLGHHRVKGLDDEIPLFALRCQEGSAA